MIFTEYFFVQVIKQMGNKTTKTKTTSIIDHDDEQRRIENRKKGKEDNTKAIINRMIQSWNVKKYEGSFIEYLYYGFDKDTVAYELQKIGINIYLEPIYGKPDSFGHVKCIGHHYTMCEINETTKSLIKPILCTYNF